MPHVDGAGGPCRRGHHRVSEKAASGVQVQGVEGGAAAGLAAVCAAAADCPGPGLCTSGHSWTQLDRFDSACASHCASGRCRAKPALTLLAFALHRRNCRSARCVFELGTPTSAIGPYHLVLALRGCTLLPSLQADVEALHSQLDELDIGIECPVCAPCHHTSRTPTTTHTTGSDNLD